jgi:purine-binding chemotaxis protein CheW
MADTEKKNSGKTSLKVIVFSVRGTEYALLVDNIFEIIVKNVLTPVPQVPEFVKGATVYRDRIIPVFDTAAVLGYAKSPGIPDKYTVIVINHDGRFIGLEADKVTEIVETAGVTLKTVIVRDLESGIEGVGIFNNRRFFLLNTNKVLNARKSFDRQVQDVIIKKLEGDPA